eukprot:TRINITY_DN4314_c0_g1_i7.p1 TRINITY_DN4314_c0_g1~~TRINITY_DN4314_c0_g1_i7.p1  ORF type:complete len:477 (-),score=87.85 TRINITY_DN4314_c0_g1_i7:363-1793(-)
MIGLSFLFLEHRQVALLVYLFLVFLNRLWVDLGRKQWYQRRVRGAYIGEKKLDMALNKYTAIPPRQTQAQPKTKSTLDVENQGLARAKSTVSSIVARSTQNREPFSNITNQNVTLKTGPKVASTSSLSQSDPTVENPTEVVKSLKVPTVQIKEVSQRNPKNLKRPASAVEPAPVGRETIQTRSMTRAKRRRSDVMEIEEIAHLPNPDWINIDAEDMDDPQMVSLYVNEIYKNLRIRERRDPISPRYMEDQSDINEKMRVVLVDWLIDVHKTFKLLPETLFMSVSILDMFLMKVPVTRDKLQLVGVTSLLIASKYQEIYPPEIADFVYVSDGTYPRDEILDCEEEILATLDYKLTTPSPLDFLRRFSKASMADSTSHSLGKYLIEISLMDLKMYKYLPSELATAAVYLARVMTHQNPIWTPTLAHYTEFSESEARTIALVLNNLLKRVLRSSCTSLRNKYSCPKLNEVATIPVVSNL